MSGNRKTERLFNLLIMLLVQRRFVSKDRIREILYPDQTTDAFEKMFERDKEELRSLGVPIEVGGMDVYFDDEPGYRIRPDQLALPDISLTADEAAVVGLATKVWEHAKLAAATTEAVRKLTAYGVPVDVGALDIGEARIGAEEPSFDVFWAAALERTPVAFDYRRVGQEPEHPAPAAVGGRAVLGALVRRRVGHRPRGRADLPAVPGPGRGPPRRRARLLPHPARDRRPRHRRAARPDGAVRARHACCVRPGAGPLLRRRADEVTEGVEGPDGEEWDRLMLPPGSLDRTRRCSASGPTWSWRRPRSLRDDAGRPAHRRARGAS